MAIVECEYKLDTTTQAPGDTIEWFHRVFLAQLATSKAHRGVPGYHPVLVEQHMDVLMAEAGVTLATAGTMTTTTKLLAHTETIAVMRAKAAETSCEEYLACKFLLLSNGERYKPLCKHLENRHTKGKKPYPTTVEGTKTLMVDYKTPGVATPRATRKDDDDQGLTFAKIQEWARMKKTLPYFGCRKKGHMLDECPETSKKERAKIWETKNKGFRRDDASNTSPTETKAKTTTGVIN